MKNILIILLLTALPTLARLGETRAECEARYGKPVRTTKKGNLLYEKAGIEIAITFWNDKAVVLFLAKAKPGGPEIDQPLEPEKYNREALSPAECDVLFKANSGNSEWGEGVEVDSNMTYWNRADRKATASYFRPILILTDVAYSDHLKAEKKKDEAKKLDGF